MKQSIINKLNLFFIAIFCIGTLYGAASAQSDKVLAAGNPPLKQSDINKAVETLEFAFGRKLSQTERSKFQEHAEIAFAGEVNQSIQDVRGLVFVNEKLSGLNEAEREETRQKFLPVLIKILKDNEDKSLHSYLLSIYRKPSLGNQTLGSNEPQKSGISTAIEDGVEVLKYSGTYKDLVGKWEKKTGGISSVDANTGRHLGSSGNYESYTFHSDGRVDYTTLIAVQNYGCRLEAFSSRKGRAGVDGSDLTVTLTGGTVRRDDSCSPNKNYSKQLGNTATSFRWRLEQAPYNGGIQLCLTQENGETYCYRKTN